MNIHLALNNSGAAARQVQNLLNLHTKVLGFRAGYTFPNSSDEPTATFLQINHEEFIEMAPATARCPAGLTQIGVISDGANAIVMHLRQAGACSDTAGRSMLSSFTDPNEIKTEANDEPSRSRIMKKAMSEGGWHLTRPLLGSLLPCLGYVGKQSNREKTYFFGGGA